MKKIKQFIDNLIILFWSMFKHHKSGYNIFLDDERSIDEHYDYLLSKPGFGKQYKTEEWVTVRNFWEFRNLIQSKGLPKRISFDHDLGSKNDILNPDGYDCAKFLVEYCLDWGLDLTTECKYHSSNPVGVKNMKDCINNLKKFQNVR